MSKAIGKVLGAGGASTSLFGSETDVINFLNNYNTKNYDNTLNNLTSYASNASEELANMGKYAFNVDGSDAARKRAEEATYNQYLDKLTPQFANQTSDLSASLANKGISIGSEAYNRAMSNLQDSQNDALNQAAYQSVLAGQNAFSNSISDQVNAGNFTNNAQSNYINQLLQALQNSYSGYDVAMDKYGILNKAENRIDQNRAYNTAAQIKAGNDFMNTTAQLTAAIASAASDIRLKENIKPVGKLDNGLTVYCFNFKGSNVSQIGLIAQEVQKTKPHAVIEGDDGYLRVDYKQACL